MDMGWEAEGTCPLVKQLASMDVDGLFIFGIEVYF